MKKTISVLCMMLAFCVTLSAAGLAAPAPAAEQESGLADGYLYCQENGMPKYWLDFTGTITDNIVLHCYFRSSDPTFYESCFILDLASAEISENELTIHQVRDLYDFDHSAKFNSLKIGFYTDGAVMTVERDEKTLAGGPEDNILTGSYVMKPVRVGVDSIEKRSCLLPAEEGPYQAEELGTWAQIRYFGNTGFFPPEAEVIENPDGTFTVHLFEIVDLDGITHTATSAWYTVDAYGDGRNDITEEEISLMR